MSSSYILNRSVGRRTLLQAGAGLLLASIANSCATATPLPTGKIFVSAGHGGFEGLFRNVGAEVESTGRAKLTEAVEMIVTRDAIVAELKSRGLTVEAPGDDLSLLGTIEWINARGSSRDIALEIRMNAFDSMELRGAGAYYIALNDERRQQAEMLVKNLIARVPQLPLRGVQPDSEAALGRLAFCRDVIPQSILLELGFITNARDRELLQAHRRDFAIGISDGLQAWLTAVSQSESPSSSPASIQVIQPLPAPREKVPEANPPFVQPISRPTTKARAKSRGKIWPQIDILINGQLYRQKGILVSGNAFVPIDVLLYLGIDRALVKDILQINYQNTTYLQAISLRDLKIFVDWNARARTIVLNTDANELSRKSAQMKGKG